MDIKLKYNQLVDKLNVYAEEYYKNDNSLISDYEYDLLYKDLLDIEKQYPEIKRDDSPSNRVGDKLKQGFTKIKHIKRMYSLDNVFSVEELVDWIYKLYLKSNVRQLDMLISNKLDGLSLNIYYKDNKLVRGVTRGDGVIGEDVTSNILYVDGIKDLNDEIELRGEVLIKKSDFNKLQEEQIKNNKELFKTARNLAAGSLRVLDPSITKSRRLTFIPWGIGYNNSHFQSLSSLLLELSKTYGFYSNDYIKIKVTDDKELLRKDITSIVTEFENNRDSLDYEIDGLVITVDNFKLMEEIGYTNKCPRYAIAYKFKAKEYETKINSITWQVGRTGVLTPVAEIEPVNIDGVIVTRCTLHNLLDIERKDIKLNDTVYIIRSGDVIPKILRPNLSKRVNSIDILPPMYCPSCNSLLDLSVKDNIKCNNVDCKDRVINSIYHAVSRDGLNIESLGLKIIEYLYDNNIIRNLFDIFKLDNVSFNNSSNIIKNIKNIKEIELWKLFYILQINNVGKGLSKVLAKELGSDFLNKTYEDIIKIEGVGEIVANDIYRELQNRKEDILELMKILNIKIEEKKTGYLSGFNICITGTFNIGRNDIIKIIEDNGGSVTNSITNKTTHILIGDNPGSKVEKANRLNIDKISIEDIVKEKNNESQ